MDAACWWVMVASNPKEAVPDEAHTPEVRPTILLVDDNPDIVEVTTDMVDICGFDAVRASNGREALDLLDGLRGRIAMLITDLIMPGEFNGLEIAEHARAQFGLPAILITGSPDHNLCRKNGDRFEILIKPFSLSDLRTRIEAALAGA